MPVIKFRRVAGWLGAASALSLTGCALDNRGFAGDPLVGGGPPLAAAPAAQAPAAAAPTAPSPPAPLASPPAPVPAGSNAALAGSTPQQLTGGADLRIAAPTPAVDGRPWQAQTTGAIVPPVPSGPVPAVAPPAPDATASRGYGAGRLATYEDAQAQLAARGVNWQRLETTADNVWKFTCSVPNPQNRLISRTYEAQAQDYLSAMRAVLDQISRDH
jgi:hypothetical protein